MARETGHRDSEIGGSKNGNNNALLESLVNGYGNGKCNECIKYCRISTLMSVGWLVVVASASLVLCSCARSQLPVPGIAYSVMYSCVTRH